MISKLYIPVYPLDQFIHHFFYYRDFNPVHSIERYLPDGNIQIIFELTDNPKYIYDNMTLREIQVCRNVWFSGFRTEPITIPSGRDSEMIIVEFQKGRSMPFVKEALHGLTNYVVDAELVIKSNLLELREKLRETPAIDQKFELLENTFLRDFRSRLQDNPFVDYTISRITSDPSQARLKAICSKVGYSHKHIIKIFRDHMGVTPKEFLKIMRFQKAVTEIEQFKAVNWSALASDCGFYDQSHFIADFKAFSGYTPSEYISRRGEVLNYIPII